MTGMLFKQQSQGDESGLGFSGRASLQIEDGIALRLRIHERLLDLLNLSVLEKTPRESLRASATAGITVSASIQLGPPVAFASGGAGIGVGGGAGIGVGGGVGISASGGVGAAASAASAACRPWISGCRCCCAAHGQALRAAVLAVAAGSAASKSSTAAGATAAC